MGDLFHEDVPDAWIDNVFAIMALCEQHTFQILTKRAQRMREYLTNPSVGMRIGGKMMECARGNAGAECFVIDLVHKIDIQKQSLANVWLGVSAEDQKTANERIPHLLDAPAAIRFVSLEPQLEEIDLNRGGWSLLRRKDIKGKSTGQLDWVIQGCESGPDARPWYDRWARLTRDQCAEVGVSYFFKQRPGTLTKKVEEKPFLDGKQHLALPGLKPAQ